MKSDHLPSVSDTLLTPALRKYIAAPLLRLVPPGVSANAITLIAHGCLYAVPFVAAVQGHAHPVAASCEIAALILLFAIGDELDGMQAVRTRTTSPLGELLDHYLDSFGPGTLLYAAWELYGISSLELLLPTIGFTFLTGAAIYHEQRRTGAMVFEAISTTESLALAAVILGLAAVPGVQRVARIEVVPGDSLLAAFLLAASLAVLVHGVTRSFLRTRALPLQWALFAVGLAAVVAGILLTAAGLTMGAAILVLYGCAHVGSIILRNLRGGRVPFPDHIAPLVLLATAAAAPRYARPVHVAALAYLGARCAWTLGAAAVSLDRPRKSACPAGASIGRKEV